MFNCGDLEWICWENEDSLLCSFGRRVCLCVCVVVKMFNFGVWFLVEWFRNWEICCFFGFCLLLFSVLEDIMLFSFMLEWLICIEVVVLWKFICGFWVFVLFLRFFNLIFLFFCLKCGVVLFLVVFSLELLFCFFVILFFFCVGWLLVILFFIFWFLLLFFLFDLVFFLCI